MATLTLTATAGSTFGSSIRSLAAALEKLAQDIPDNNPTGASSVLTLDNGTGFCKVTVSAGPYPNATGFIAS